MFDNLRKRLSAISLLAGLPAPIPVGTVTGRIVSDEPPLEEVPTPPQPTYGPSEQQVVVGMDFANEPGHDTKLMQIPRDPGLSLERKLKVSSKKAAAWNKLKPTSLSAEDVARLDAAQQKRDRKAAKRADDRHQTVSFWTVESNYCPKPLGDHNAYAVR